MGTRIPTPHLYVNVHQTIWVMLAAGVVGCYILDVKGVRTSLNQVMVDISKARR